MRGQFHMHQLKSRIKWAVRDLAGSALQWSGLTSPALWARDKLTVVTFHRVLPPDLLAQYPLPAIAVTPEELEFFLSVFQEHYCIGTLSEMALRHQRGERGEKPLLAITFDDGQLDNHLYARPALEARGLRATFYVVTQAAEGNETLWHDRMALACRRAMQHASSACQAWLDSMGVPASAVDAGVLAVERAKALSPQERMARLGELEALTDETPRPAWDSMMSWDQLRAMQAAGHEIGSHSASHPILPLLDDEALRLEIEGSRQTLQDQLGQAVHSFCYPNGDHDERVVKAVLAAGYRFAVTTRYGVNPADAAPTTLRRVDIQGRFGRDAQGKLASGGLLMRLTGRWPGLA